MSDCTHERTWMVRVWAGHENFGIDQVCRDCGARRLDDVEAWAVERHGSRYAHGCRWELLPPHPAVTMASTWKRLAKVLRAERDAALDGKRAAEDEVERLSNPAMRHDREFLGRLVRMVWVEWAKWRPNPKPSWLVLWDGLSEQDKEVDRRIGERVAEVATALVERELEQERTARARAEAERDDLRAQLSALEARLDEANATIRRLSLMRECPTSIDEIVVNVAQDLIRERLPSNDDERADMALRLRERARDRLVGGVGRAHAPYAGCDAADDHEVDPMHAVADDDCGAHPWNTCPRCGNRVDIDEESFDGTEVRCLGCRTWLVLVALVGGAWVLDEQQADEEACEKPAAAVDWSETAQQIQAQTRVDDETFRGILDGFPPYVSGHVGGVPLHPGITEIELRPGHPPRVVGPALAEDEEPSAGDVEAAR